MANTERVKEAVARAGFDAVVLMDDRDIYYATGFLPTDSAAIIARDAAWLVTDSRYIEAAQNQAAPGVEVILTTRERPLLSILHELAERNSLEKLGAEEEKLSHAMYLRLEKALGRELLPAQEMLVELRACKTQEELRSLIAAQRIAETALEEVLPLIKPGAVEREIAAELTYRMRMHGAEGNSFDPIVVTGAKSSMPHGVPGDEVVKSGDFVTMDFGCLKNGYCSDMTRTVAVGSATDEMRNVYYTVLEAQKAGIAAARPGVPGADIHNAAAKVIADAGYGAYFGHGFGHSLGLDIHEQPSASPANLRPMPEGAVISAEPGIYLPGKFGVRIEDVLYLTGDGCENITKAPKDLLIL